MKHSKNNGPRASRGQTNSPQAETDQVNCTSRLESKKHESSADPGGATKTAKSKSQCKTDELVSESKTDVGPPAAFPTSTATPSPQPLPVSASGLRPKEIEFEEGESRIIKEITGYHCADLMRSFGTEDLNLFASLFHQILQAVPISCPTRSIEVNSALAMIRNIAPKDAFEQVLAVHFWAAQRLAMMNFQKAADPTLPAEQIDPYMNRFTKATRVCRETMEALDHRRGRVSQQVVVGNVNVNSGGQAIVGTVERSDPRRESSDAEKKKR